MWHVLVEHLGIWGGIVAYAMLIILSVFGGCVGASPPIYAFAPSLSDQEFESEFRGLWRGLWITTLIVFGGAAGLVAWKGLVYLPDAILACFCTSLLCYCYYKTTRYWHH